MANLFSKAKKTTTKSTTKESDKLIIKIDDDDFFNDVEELQELQKRMKSDKTKSDKISNDIKKLTKEKWLELYKDSGENPGSVIFAKEENDKFARVMFVPSDKYIKIDEKRKNELQEKYGDDIITEETEFSFDSEMIEKYGEVLSELIMGCEEIDDSDKEKIIVSKTSFNIAKGTLDKLIDYGELNEVMEDINPVLSIKNVEIIKS